MTRVMTPDPREVKLPNWARDTINELRRLTQAAESAAENARMATKPDESNTLIERYSAGDIGLGQSPTIKFKLGDGWDQYLHARLENGRLIIHGGDQIALRPQSGNAVAIWTQR